MIRPRTATAAVLAALLPALAACQKAGDGAKVDELAAKLAKAEERLAKLEGFLGPYMNQPPPEPEPDPAATYAVPVDGAPSKGPEAAPVTIVEAFEFACPYCEKVRPTIDQLLKDYGDDVRVVYKQFVVHPDVATAPALAACAAAQQGKFAELEHLIWEKGFKERNLDPAHLKDLAKEAKLDVAAFDAAVAGPECAAKVQQDQDDLRRFGVNGTPAFFINGRHLSGAQPLGAFKQVIDEELAKAKAAIGEGTAVGDYYKVAVLEKGLKELAKPAQQAAPH